MVVAVGIPLLAEGVASPSEVLSPKQLVGLTVPLLVAFSATTLPSLLTRDRRDRVLSLYFSTALSRAEYVAGKVLAALALMSLVTLGPLLALLVGTVVTADAPLSQLRSDVGDLPATVLAGLVVAAYYAAAGLLAGSLTGKRVFAVGGLLAVLLVTPVVSGIAYGISDDRDLLALDLSQAPVRAAATLLSGSSFEPEPPAGLLVWLTTAVVVLLAAVVLAVRYGRSDPS